MSKTTTDSKKAAKAGRKKATGKVHLAILMDESGSMQGLEESVVGGCNDFLHEFRNNDSARAWLAWFDATPGEPQMRYKAKGKKIASVPMLGPEDYNPRGATPLNDSILALLSSLDAKVAKDEMVFMAIITDGLENASEVKDPAVVAKAIAKFEKRGWVFVYLGANQDSVSTASSLGLTKKGQAFNTLATSGGTRSAMRSTARYAGQTMTAYAASGGDAQMAKLQSDTLRETEFDKTGGTIEEDDEE